MGGTRATSLACAGVALAIANCNAIIGLDAGEAPGGEGGAPAAGTATGGMSKGATSSTSTSTSSAAEQGSSISSASSMVDTVTSSATGPVGCSQDGTSSISDDFDTLSSGFWTLDVATASTAASVGGEAVLNVDGGEGGMDYVHIYTADTYSLSGCTLSIELVEAATGANNTTYFELTDTTDAASAKSVGFFMQSGMMLLKSTENGQTTSQTIMVTPPLYLRLSDDGAHLHFETSTDDAAWVDAFSVPTPAWIATGHVQFGISNELLDGVADEAKFDKFNL